MGKIFAQTMSDKGIIFKRYKTLTKINKFNYFTKTWSEEMNRH